MRREGGRKKSERKRERRENGEVEGERCENRRRRENAGRMEKEDVGMGQNKRMFYVCSFLPYESSLPNTYTRPCIQRDAHIIMNWYYHWQLLRQT